MTKKLTLYQKIQRWLDKNNGQFDSGAEWREHLNAYLKKLLKERK